MIKSYRRLAAVLAAVVVLVAGGVALANGGQFSPQRHITPGGPIPCNQTIATWGCNHSTSLCDPEVVDVWCWQECIPGGQNSVHVRCMSPNTAAGW